MQCERRLIKFADNQIGNEQRALRRVIMTDRRTLQLIWSNARYH